MNYQETLNYLYNQLPVYQHVGGSAYKAGLDNSIALDNYFGHPHRKYRTVHVAGTNGKGSTSHLIAAVLQESGYRVGLYTSPHLLDFRERIRVNGEVITEQYVIDFVTAHREHFEPIQPSFFELTMMMAFQYFADSDVEIAVIEVGLGGRLDSTNIIKPIVSVITNISLDHTQYLGEAVEKIAIEKAGIIKPNVPVVIGEAQGDVRSAFEKKAIHENAPIIFAQQNCHIFESEHLEDGSWLFQTEKYPDLKCELGGLPQLENAATVLCTIDALLGEGIAIIPEAVYNGFARVVELTGLMGRWQVIQEQHPRIICDTAHNIGGIEYVAKQLAHENYKELHMIIGMVNDKDVTLVLAQLPKNAIYYFTRASIARAMDEKELAFEATKLGLEGNLYKTVNDALDAALKNSAANDLVFIGGSNFIVAEALEYFQK